MQNMFQFLEEPSRLSAGLAGMEIGLYNSIGYIAQAVGLRTTTASKVRLYYHLFSLDVLSLYSYRSSSIFLLLDSWLSHLFSLLLL